MADASQQSLRILSIGAGAIGTYIGGSLALNGHSVVFLERSSVVEELKQNGIVLTIGDNTRRIPNPQAVASLAEAFNERAYDVALFALKSYDTSDAIEVISPLS